MTKDTYTFADGSQTEYEHIIFPGLDGEMTNELSIKVNIPEDEAGFKSGSGEGIWMLVSPTTKAKLDTDYTSKPGEFFFGRLLNHSVYYLGLLRWGMIVPFEMRGHKRPVAIVREIQTKHYGADQALLDTLLAQLPKDED